MANRTVGGLARADVLARIRAAKCGGSDAATVAAEWAEIARDYKRQASGDPDSVLQLLIDRLRDYDAQVLSVPRTGIGEGVAQMLGARGVRRLVIPAGLPKAWLPDGFLFVEDCGLAATELDAADGVLTGATVAIAETGTIVLQNSPAQGRRAVSLVPDYHLCVVDARHVVETVSEAIAWIGKTAGLATTFISGPSATADIEMTRIKGVHGPRFLDVVVGF